MLLLQVLARATRGNRLPAHEACGKWHVLPTLQTKLNAQQIIATNILPHRHFKEDVLACT